MTTGNQAALSSTAHATFDALKALVVAVALCLLVLLRVFATALKEVFDLIRKFAPWICKGLAIAADLAAIVIVFPVAWSAYGADAPAILPAAVICILPVMIAVSSGLGWNAFYAAAIVTLMFGGIAAIDVPVIRAGLIIAAISVYTFHKIKEGKDTDHHEAKSVDNRNGDSGTGPAGLYGQPDNRPVQPHPAGGIDDRGDFRPRGFGRGPRWLD